MSRLPLDPAEYKQQPPPPIHTQIHTQTHTMGGYPRLQQGVGQLVIGFPSEFSGNWRIEISLTGERFSGSINTGTVSPTH